MGRVIRIGGRRLLTIIASCIMATALEAGEVTSPGVSAVAKQSAVLRTNKLRRNLPDLQKDVIARAPRIPAGSSGGVIAGSTCTLPGGNCQIPDLLNAVTSDRNSFFIVADDFTPATNGSITQICWRGIYFDFTSGLGRECSWTPPDRFEIKYYENVDGLPGALLASFSQTRGTLAVTGPTATGQHVGSPPEASEYEYSATHAAVDVQAGQCYWVEISNGLTECSWLWGTSAAGNLRSLQGGDGEASLQRYDHDDLTRDDKAFCVSQALGDPTLCAPPPPANNYCETPEILEGEGTFPFDNFGATTTGPEHAECFAAETSVIQDDVWFCWTATCTGDVLAWTCDQTDVDTKIAVYDGCRVCPPTDEDLLACNDDRCGTYAFPLQSMVGFPVIEGRNYAIRLGVYPWAPGAVGSFSVSCDPPPRDDCLVGDGDCCDVGGTGSPACDDQRCCETVCLCDAFCCEVAWDMDCATGGFLESGCGAAELCMDSCVICGSSSSGDCCSANGTVGCNNESCCETVCEADVFCCEVEWDEGCATTGYNGNGNGAAVLCPELCGEGACPDGAVTFLDPPAGTIDARQPHPPSDAEDLQGIDTLLVEAPQGADNATCWSLSETLTIGSDNAITSVIDNGNGTFKVRLLRPITANAVTSITYTSGDGVEYTGTFTSHPANIDGNGHAAPDDITAMIECCLAPSCSPARFSEEKLYRCDTDRNGTINPADMLRTIDLLNGGDEFIPWSGTPLP